MLTLLHVAAVALAPLQGILLCQQHHLGPEGLPQQGMGAPGWPWPQSAREGSVSSTHGSNPEQSSGRTHASPPAA